MMVIRGRSGLEIQTLWRPDVCPRAKPCSARSRTSRPDPDPDPDPCAGPASALLRGAFAWACVLVCRAQRERQPCCGQSRSLKATLRVYVTVEGPLSLPLTLAWPHGSVQPGGRQTCSVPPGRAPPECYLRLIVNAG